MNIDEIICLPDPRKAVKISTREVVREFENRPHVFVRVRLSGWHFPERAPEPFMVVGKTVSKFVLISGDGSIADGYFDTMPAAAKVVRFGYGKIISWDFTAAFKPTSITRLNRALLPRGHVGLHS